MCMECHSTDLDLPPLPAHSAAPDQSPDADEAQTFLHGPVREGLCGECHRIHDGPLRGVVPKRPYASYERAAYSACWSSCHLPELVEESTTTTATRFRNGDDNLHFRHVAKQQRGRSCGLCHAPHQAEGPGLIQRGMPFGDEVLTLEFTPTETGGRCATSCHIPVGYDRQQAIPSIMRTQ